MENRQIMDDAVMWLSLLSIAVICLLMLYIGAAGLVRLPSTGAAPMKQLFAVSVYVLFIILPLMIVNLVLDTTIISEVFEWSASLIYVAIVVDIVLMTVFYLLM